MMSCSTKARTERRVISCASLRAKSIGCDEGLPPDKISEAPSLMTREPFAESVPVTLEPLQTTEAHAFWNVFVSGRSDLPTKDLKVHLDRYLSLPPEEQRSHFAAKKDGRLIGTVRLGAAEISGFSMDPHHAAEAV